MNNYTIKAADLVKTAQKAAEAGYKPLLYINGEYYEIELEKPVNGQIKGRENGQ